MFWRKKHSKIKNFTNIESETEYELQRNRLFETQLYLPRHKKTELPDKNDGLGWASDVEEHIWSVDYFTNFANYVHKFHAPGESYDVGPWRIEQMSDPFLSLAGIDDGPIVGLRYRIFYNSEEVGNLEIEPASNGLFEVPDDYYRANLYIALNYVAFLPYEHISGLLSICSKPFDAFLLDELGENRNETIMHSIFKALWESNREDSLWVALNFRFGGTVSKKRPPR